MYYSFYGRPNPALTLAHIVRSFDETAQDTSADAALRLLANKQALILLDGTEEADNLHVVLDIKGQCGVLVTSRRRKDAVAERLDIGPLKRKETVKLLRAWGKERAADETAVQKICILLGGLPLAVRLVGRYLDQQEEEAADYLKWLEETPLTALDQGQRQLDSVPLLLERSLSQISDEARLALVVVGILNLAPFHREVVSAVLGMPAVKVGRFLGELVNYGLLLRTEQCYEVSHALIHTYARRRMRGTSMTPEEVIERLVVYFTALAKEQYDLGHLGIAYLHLGQYELAIDYCKRALVIRCEIGDRQGEGLDLGNLGEAYARIGQYEQAIEYYQQALSIYQKFGDRRGEAGALGHLGLAYRDLSQTERAKQYLRQSLAIFEKIKSSNADLVRNWLAQLEE